MNKPMCISYRFDDGRVFHCELKWDYEESMTYEKITQIEKLSSFLDWQPVSKSYITYIKEKFTKLKP